MHRAKLLQLFSQRPMNQQRSPCCNNFLTPTESYHSKVIPIVILNAEKIAEAVLLCVFTITFPSFLFVQRPIIWLWYKSLVASNCSLNGEVSSKVSCDFV